MLRVPLAVTVWATKFSFWKWDNFSCRDCENIVGLLLMTVTDNSCQDHVNIVGLLLRTIIDNPLERLGVIIPPPSRALNPYHLRTRSLLTTKWHMVRTSVAGKRQEKEGPDEEITVAGPSNTRSGPEGGGGHRERGGLIERNFAIFCVSYGCKRCSQFSLSKIYSLVPILGTSE